MMHSSDIEAQNSPKLPRKRVLMLGYDRSQTRIIDPMVAAGCEVDHSRKYFNHSGYDLIISFGYRHILKKKVLDQIVCPIINLHISYLPYNRGAHPNFWSFFENTPHGVTIHLIDDGIDTGPILFQKYVHFDDSKVTFANSYQTLFREVESLFISHLAAILECDWEAKPQQGIGSVHSSDDLPSDFRGWDSNVGTEIERLHSLVED